MSQSKKKVPKPRNNVAMGMIVARTGIAKFHSDKRNRRGKLDKQWRKELD